MHSDVSACNPQVQCIQQNGNITQTQVHDWHKEQAQDSSAWPAWSAAVVECNSDIEQVLEQLILISAIGHHMHEDSEYSITILPHQTLGAVTVHVVREDRLTGGMEHNSRLYCL